MKNFVIKIIVVIAFFIAAYHVCKYTPYYVEKVHYDKNEIRFVIDGVEKTKSMPDPVEIADGKVMLSVDTVREYFDKYAYYNEEFDTVMIAYGLNIVKMPVDSTQITVNDQLKSIAVPAKTYHSTVYIPIEELAEVYDIDVIYNQRVMITTADSQYYTVLPENKLNIKTYQMEKCRSAGISKANEPLYIFDDYEEKTDNEYVWVRSAEGILGYVKKKKIKVKEVLARPAGLISKAESGETQKISIAWEYAANYTPDRSLESKRSGLDVLAPTWFYVKNTSGDMLDLASTSYLSWANKVGYEVWPTIKNDNISIGETSNLITNIYARKTFIDNILALCQKYHLTGINLDFENMYEKDKDEFSAFVRELAITLKQNEIVTSVDVNVPDGSPTWSRCYDSKAISDAVDYIIVMTYDQYSGSSKKAGPVASLDWVEGNIIKMTKRDGIDSTKLVLGVPFYSRSWTTDENEVVTSTSAIYMSRVKELMTKNPNSITWDEAAGQNIIRYTTKAGLVTVYVEDANSIAKKLDLVEKYNLAGAAAWRLGFESDDVWRIFSSKLK